MKYTTGDLLEGDWDCACHVANCYCIMGSGVAYSLANKWPIVFEEDFKTSNLSEEKKLGHFTCANVEPNRFVYNLYAQKGIGNDGTPLNRNCSYDELYNSLYRACEHMREVFPLQDNIRVGVPKYIGCCRAGGEWLIVDAILASIEETFPEIFFIVYELKNGK